MKKKSKPLKRKKSVKRKPRRKQLNDSPARWKAILKKYGLSKTYYNTILDIQGGRCYICRRSPEEIKRKQHLAVDHEHKTGRIRGLLCFNCNHKLLGQLIKDDKEMARRLLQYLERETNYGVIPSEG